jgi:hypothetical protein
MTIGSCRGDTNRDRIAEGFHIRPLLHTHVPGQYEIRSCCERQVGTYYYLLKSQSKTNPADTERFYAGRRCAEKLLERCGIALLPVVSNFALPRTEPSEEGSGSGQPGERKIRVRLTPLNREAQTLLTLIVATIFPALPEPGKGVENLLGFISANPDRDMYPRELRGLSTIVGRFVHRNHGIDEIANRLERKYGEPIETREFPRLREAFARHKISDPVHTVRPLNAIIGRPNTKKNAEPD